LKKLQLPGTFVHYRDIKDADKCLKGVDVAYDGETFVALIKGKKWTILPTNRSDMRCDVDGSIGGYCVLARSVAYCLAQLGLWSQKAAEDFDNTYYERDMQNVEASKAQRYLSGLAEMGYDVSGVKKAKVKKL
jgi:hypothetical protein